MDHPVKDDLYLSKFPEHEKVALQTARESVVLYEMKKIFYQYCPAVIIKFFLQANMQERFHAEADRQMLKVITT